MESGLEEIVNAFNKVLAFEASSSQKQLFLLMRKITSVSSEKEHAR